MGRVWAAVAVSTSLLGALGLVIATRDGPGMAGYVSESGVAGAPHALLYRISLLVFGIAAGAAALALRPAARLAALCLGLAMPCVLVSSAARCSAGCPLPPFQRPTTGDLIHAGASIAAVGLCALAILAAAAWSVDPVVRAVSRWSVVLSMPLLTAMAVGLLTVGHGRFTGVVERLSLTGCLAWLVAVCGVRTRQAAGDQR